MLVDNGLNDICKLGTTRASTRITLDCRRALAGPAAAMELALEPLDEALTLAWNASVSA